MEENGTLLLPVQDAAGSVDYQSNDYDDASYTYHTSREAYQTIVMDLLVVDTSLGPIPPAVYLLFIVIGITGNIANIIVFTRPNMLSSVNLLLSSFEGVNIIVFLTYLPILTRTISPLFSTTLTNAILDLFSLYVETAVICISNWLSVTIGLWRLIAVGRPLSVEIYCNRKRTALAIGAVVLSSMILAIPFAFVGSYQVYTFYVKSGNDTAEVAEYLYVSIPSDYLKYKNGLILDMCYGLNLLTTSVPCFMLAAMTLSLLWFLWRAREERKSLTQQSSESRATDNPVHETRITIMLTTILLLFWFAYLPDSIANVLVFTLGETEAYKTKWHEIAKTRFCVLISNCLTFSMYFIISEKYRETFKKIFIRKYWEKVQKKIPWDTTVSHIEMDPLSKRSKHKSLEQLYAIATQK